MRKTACYIVLSLYALVLIRPAIPFLGYMINYDYITQVLCINKDNPTLNCNGSCFLTQDIQKTQLTEMEEGQITFPILDLGIFVLAFQDINSYDLSLIELDVSPDYYFYNMGDTSNYHNKIIHPPEFLVAA